MPWNQINMSVNTLKAILVDDEQIARQRFASLIAEFNASTTEQSIEIIGEAASGTEAIPMIYSLKPDVVFLDIQMPGLNGFEILDLLTFERPHIVFVTAYDEFALKAFEVHAIDYLTKPVRIERLTKTINRLFDTNATKQQTESIQTLSKERETQQLARLTVHDGDKLKVVKLDEIKRIEAEDKEVYIYLSTGRFTSDFTLDSLESRLNPEQFMRVHRSHIVSIDAVKELIPWFSGTYCLKLDDGTQLPVARRRVKDIKALFGRK